MPTIVVTEPYTLAEGQSVSFANENGFMLQGMGSLTLAGAATVVAADGAAIPAEGIFGVAPGGAGRVRLEATGSLRVESQLPASAAGSDATGIAASPYASSMYNYGLVEVAANGAATGIRLEMTASTNGNYNLITIGGSGTVRVTSHGDAATGVAMDTYRDGRIHSNGAIEVTGHTAAVGVSVVGEYSHFSNHGTIRAHAADGESVGVHWSATTASFYNGGTIAADWALRVVALSKPAWTEAAFRNFGDMIGDIDLGSGSNYLTNEGRIVGDVWLGSGDDVYTSTQGVLDGRAFGGMGADTLKGSPNAERFLGEAGADNLSGGGGDDSLDGGADSDFVRGGDGNDSLAGGGDFDDLHGNIGDDLVWGGDADDWVVGGQGHDRLFGDAGWDVVLGNLGNDSALGGVGGDWVRGGQGDDAIFGEDGDDWLSGDRGSDTLYGGAGADIFHTWSEAGMDRVTDFNALDGDRVNLLAGTTYTLTQLGADTVIDLGAGHQMVLVGVQLTALPAGWIFGA